MNEQEAIEQLQNEYLVSMTGRDAVASVRYHNEALDTAIAALKEVQEYHATGHTPKMVRELIRGYLNAHKQAVQHATELDEYIRLGGLEVCKEAVEKQTGKKPTSVLGIFGGTENECKNCGNDVRYRDEYCRWCGQKLDWSDGE